MCVAAPSWGLRREEDVLESLAESWDAGRCLVPSSIAGGTRTGQMTVGGGGRWVRSWNGRGAGQEAGAAAATGAALIDLYTLARLAGCSPRESLHPIARPWRRPCPLITRAARVRPSAGARL